jgi:hypothetical protein
MVTGWDRLESYFHFTFHPHQTNRTEPEPILHNFIRGFGISRVARCSSYPHICPLLSHPITALSALNALPLSSHLLPFLFAVHFYP